MAAVRKLGARYQLDFTLFGHRIRTNFHEEAHAEDFKERLSAALPVRHRSIETAIAEYLKNETDKRKIPQTRIMERLWFFELKTFLDKECKLSPASSVTAVRRFHLEKFQAHLKANGSARGRTLSSSSVNRRFNSIKNLFQKLHDWEFTPDNRAAGIRNLPTKLVRRVNWKPDELVHVLSTLPRESLEYDLIRFLDGTGMRLGSALEIRLEDIDLHAELIVVRQRKGREGQENFYVIPLPPSLMELIRRRMPARAGSTLFRHDDGSIVGVHLVSKRCSRHFSSLGLPHLTLHGLRHSLATRLKDRGADIESIRKLLGHKNIRTTQDYLHTEFEHLRRWLE